MWLRSYFVSNIGCIRGRSSLMQLQSSGCSFKLLLKGSELWPLITCYFVSIKSTAETLLAQKPRCFLPLRALQGEQGYYGFHQRSLQVPQVWTPPPHPPLHFIHPSTQDLEKETIPYNSCWFSQHLLSKTRFYGPSTCHQFCLSVTWVSYHRVTKGVFKKMGNGAYGKWL